MSDEDKDSKTEDATPRRLEDARKDGQVAMSTEFIAGIMLAATVGAFLLLGRSLSAASGQLILDGATNASNLALDELAVGDFTSLMRSMSESLLVPFATLVGPVLIVGFLTGYGQVGIQLSTKAVGIKPEKLDPIAGAKKILGPRGYMRTLLLVRW